MDITALVNSVAPYIIMAAPYLKQLGNVAGEESAKELSKQAAKKLGEGSWGIANSIWQKLRGAKPETQTAIDSALNDIADAPTDLDTHAALRVKLRKALTDDATLFESLAQIIREAGGTNINGERNTVLGDNAQDNVIITGDGVIIGSDNINLVNKKS